MSPTVSVVIPCFNAERFIAETLESVFAQTYRNLDIIVVDDGSTDSSANIVRSLGDPRVRLVQRENGGQTAALNTGLAHASGDYVQFIDADDVIDPDKIELQLRRLEGAPRAVASSEWGRFYDRPENTLFVVEDVYQDLAPLDWLALSRADGLGMMMPALWLIPMPIVKAAGPWREDLTLNNDAEYFTRVLLASEKVLFCGGAKCRYRSGIQGSLSGQKSARHFESQLKVLDLVEGYILRAEDSERMRRGLSLSWQHIAHAAYPYASDVAEVALKRAHGLHPVTIRPGGGVAFKTLSRMVGWRAARRIQVALGR